MTTLSCTSPGLQAGDCHQLPEGTRAAWKVSACAQVGPPRWTCLRQEYRQAVAPCGQLAGESFGPWCVSNS